MMHKLEKKGRYQGLSNVNRVSTSSWVRSNCNKRSGPHPDVAAGGNVHVEEADPRLVFRILGTNVLAFAAIVREHQRLVFSLGFITDDYEYHATVWTLNAFSF
jgi:hypothetical protein